MKILWLCNCPLLNSDIAASGTWIQSLAEVLLSTKSIELAVIAFSEVAGITRHDYREVKQWLVPHRAVVGKNGLPSEEIVKEILGICESFEPEIVHVWGVESYWGLLTARGHISRPALLEMQGMKKACARVYTADLSAIELLQCVGIKEVFKRKTLLSYKNDFAAWGRFEDEILLGHRFIDVQSDWMASQVSSVQPDARQFPVELVLRRSFYEALPWTDFELERAVKGTAHNIFLSSSGAFPYKGVHVALRAFALLRSEFTGARLRIAGLIHRLGLRQDGYARWLFHLCTSLGIADSVDWLGPLDADQIVCELQQCGVSVVCSFVESYCLALAEPAFLGVPCVTSYSGGTSWIARNGEEALFYPPGDAAMCAHQIRRLFRESELRCRLSKQSRAAGLVRHDRDVNAERMIAIYRQVATITGTL